MKRSVLLISLVFVLSQVSCSDIIDDTTVYRVGLTQTASALPPTPVSTPNPTEGWIVNLLNANLQTFPADSLSQTLDATYTILGASFLPTTTENPTVLKIKVQCVCARNGTCCNVEHTFVVIISAMRVTPDIFINLVPQSIVELQVSCHDPDKLMGIMAVSWEMMKCYLSNHGVTGYQLGDAVHKLPTPSK